MSTLINNINLGKVYEIARRAGLTSDEEKTLARILLSLDSDSVKETLDVLTEQPAWAKKIIHNYHSKKEAVAMNNAELWQEIVMSEEKDLKEIGK